jgi:hypothetical protein
MIAAQLAGYPFAEGVAAAYSDPRASLSCGAFADPVLHARLLEPLTLASGCCGGYGTRLGAERLPRLAGRSARQRHQQLSDADVCTLAYPLFWGTGSRCP